MIFKFSVIIILNAIKLKKYQFFPAPIFLCLIFNTFLNYKLQVIDNNSLIKVEVIFEIVLIIITNTEVLNTLTFLRNLFRYVFFF